MPTQCLRNANAQRTSRRWTPQKKVNKGFYFKGGFGMVRLSDGSLARSEIRNQKKGITARFGGLVWTGLLAFFEPISRQPALQSGFFIARDLTSRMRRRVSNPRPDGSLACKQGNQANPALTVPIVTWSGKLPLADRSKCRKHLPAREGMFSTPLAYSYGLERLDTFPGKKGNL